MIHNLHGYMSCSNLQAMLQETGDIQTAGTFKPSQSSSSLLCIANLYSKLRKRNAEIVRGNMQSAADLTQCKLQ